MIIFMFELICVTNRALCADSFPARIRALSWAGIHKIILREKDLAPKDYQTLAMQLSAICPEKLIPNSIFCPDIPRLHLPFPLFLQQPALRKNVDLLGVSVHTPEEARHAWALGADYLIAGHIFPTDCKPGVPARGLDFLRSCCNAVDIPVYAIGGISADNLAAVQQVGTAGACLMSRFMQCDDIPRELSRLHHAIKKYVPDPK